jgi:glycerophosphoryl diester phosphodiesterase
MRKRWVVLGALTLAAGALFALNTSLLARPAGELTLLAHRGVHQDYHRENLNNETCTAERIYPPTHALLENTLPSMQAAFDAGAGIIEIDIHPTTDGEFAVFHDWTVDCRTNGQGVTRELSMAYLKTLDIGYGYTADGGQTYPFRGQGVGQMPTLREVLEAFPDQRFLINFKSRKRDEADRLLAYLQAMPAANIDRLSYYGAEPAMRMRELLPNARTTGRRQLMDCAKNYMLTGWTGHVGAVCRDTIVFVPSNYGWVAWGWPNRFLQRMQDANSEVIIVGAIRRSERPGVGGVDSAEAFEEVPRDWRGGVATDRIEIIGPLAAERRTQ